MVNDDAISRIAVLELVANYDLSMGQVVKAIHALPPVNPEKYCSNCVAKIVARQENGRMCKLIQNSIERQVEIFEFCCKCSSKH